jgi:hypothetical protein
MEAALAAGILCFNVESAGELAHLSAGRRAHGPGGAPSASA